MDVCLPQVVSMKKIITGIWGDQDDLLTSMSFRVYNWLITWSQGWQGKQLRGEFESDCPGISRADVPWEAAAVFC